MRRLNLLSMQESAEADKHQQCKEEEGYTELMQAIDTTFTSVTTVWTSGKTNNLSSKDSAKNKLKQWNKKRQMMKSDFLKGFQKQVFKSKFSKKLKIKFKLPNAGATGTDFLFFTNSYP